MNTTKHLIIVDGIPVGFFADVRDRDAAFDKYIQYGIKGER